MPERRYDVPFGPGGRPDPAPGAPPETGLTVRLETLRELAIALLEEVDSIKGSGSLEKGSGSLEAKPGVDFFEEVRRFEADLIRWALIRAGGHQRRAARMLNLKATTLNCLIKRHGIQSEAFKTENDTPLP